MKLPNIFAPAAQGSFVRNSDITDHPPRPQAGVQETPTRRDDVITA